MRGSVAGNIRLGMLDNYDDVFVEINGDDKGVVPRNWLTVGTIGSGKTNTNQVFIEETLEAGYAQIVVDPEGEYIFMDQPSDAQNVVEDIQKFGRHPKGVKKITVYRPPLSDSKQADAIEFSVPFDSLSPEIIPEITEMPPAQRLRFPALYEQATQLLRRKNGGEGILESEDLDISRGYPGITLQLLLDLLDEETRYYEWKRANKGSGSSKTAKKRNAASEGGEDEGLEEAEGMKIYCHEYNSTLAIQESTPGRSGKDGEAPSSNSVKSGGEVDITK
jgi:Helicase HerA, central domain